MADLEITKSTSSSRERDLPLADPANVDEDVFIPLEATVTLIKDIVASKGSATFIRAPVAAGKTTLAKYLAAKHKNEFVMVDMVDKEEEMIEGIIRASGIQGTSLKDALKALASNKKTLILDEAHMVFSMPSLYYNLFKAPQQWQELKPPKILLFSAASEGQGGQGAPTATPAEIKKKYMWYPPVPDAGTLSANLAAAEVYLDAESVDFFMKICAGHRGIFMHAMEWVQQLQLQQQPGNNIPWDIHQSVSRVKSSFTRSKEISKDGWQSGLRKCMKQSRAIRVNGSFGDITNIPTKFPQVLFGGAKKKVHLGGNLRSLTISGFLVPERQNDGDEFVCYDWDDPTKRFGVANSLMAEYYSDIFSSELGYQRECTKKTPHSAADLVARAIPFMSFAAVIDNPLPDEAGEGSNAPLSQSTTNLKTPLSKDALPFEDHYNDGLAAALIKLGYAVSRPLNQTSGKVDVVVTYHGSKTCALENIMATRPPPDQQEHASRFGDPIKSNYSNATLKGLITIGSNKRKILRRLRETSGTTEGLELIGLVVSAAHDGYEMYVRPSLLRVDIQGPFFLVCDQVAKSLDLNAAKEEDIVVAANRLQTPKKRSHQDAVSTNSSAPKKLKSD